MKVDISSPEIDAYALPADYPRQRRLKDASEETLIRRREERVADADKAARTATLEPWTPPQVIMVPARREPPTAELQRPCATGGFLVGPRRLNGWLW